MFILRRSFTLFVNNTINTTSEFSASISSESSTYLFHLSFCKHEYLIEKIKAGTEDRNNYRQMKNVISRQRHILIKKGLDLFVAFDELKRTGTFQSKRLTFLLSVSAFFRHRDL